MDKISLKKLKIQNPPVSAAFFLMQNQDIFYENYYFYKKILTNLVIGICVFQVVLDEAQINYFVVNQKFRKKGFGSYLMSYLIKKCEKLNLKKILLEVSQDNVTAEGFYSRFDFSTVGIRKNYYKDGSHALLKEKKLTTK